MLKKFFMGVLSSFVGAWIAIALFGIVAVAVIFGVLAKIGISESVSGVGKDSILTIELNGPIVETAEPVDINYMSLARMDMSRPQTLLDIITALDEAADNRNVVAVYLKCNGAEASPATLDAVREALVRFQKSGKPVYAFGESYTTGDYFVASCADRIFVNPAGEVALRGLGSTNPYMKDLFDKLGVEFQVVKVGKFKSAVEPYIMQHMSEPARAQLDTLFSNMWAYVREGISSGRNGVTPAEIDSLVSLRFIQFAPAKEAVKADLVDSMLYQRKVDEILAGYVGVDVKKLKFVSPQMLVSQADRSSAYTSGNQIAILYAVGEITDGGGSGCIDYLNLVPKIVELADNDNVKGMVLRVNSPGGSAFGSEQIGEALDYFKSKGKKLAVSMGDYAASGGYWISCGADIIYADALTVTGSIGIFGLIPNVKGLADKLGVNMERVNTNPDADFPSFFFPMNETQQNVLQKYVSDGYDKFITRVARGRNMKKEEVMRIGEGRVWDGRTAVRIGLVDSIGGLSKAIDWVARNTNLGSSYGVAIYPKYEANIFDYLPSGSTSLLAKALVSALGENCDKALVEIAERVVRQNPVQARIQPMTVRFN